jgi:hypothetical protein
MSDTNPPTDAQAALTQSLARFDAERAVYGALEVKLRDRNKTILFDALAAAGVSHVMVSFDGYGDSGQIESVEAKAGDDTVDLPDAEVTVAIAEWGKADAESRSLPLADMVESMTYDFLAQTHGGWENNGGAYGDFTFDVSERSIKLDYHERFESSENHQHSF